ncbi:site-2 protease family protein [Rhodoflexus caldus]|uniref:site-2 protease family protein n=1 Tax=Rhodoflexus caldus TaxID=2891236 RepID=UPI00202AAA77|nr:site-2 protease family protein [Rhodoflexus caldus]
MKYSLSLGKILGIHVQIHWTFLILIGWIVISNLSAGNSTEQTLWAVLFVLTIFACVTLHEFGHALAARRYGIETQDITLLPIGGLARLASMPEKPMEELVVALAGPAVNIVISALIYPFLHISEGTEISLNLRAVDGDTFLLSLMAVNLWLALFNMIPAFPMDGGRVLRALLSFRMERAAATRVAAAIGQFLAIGFVILGFLGNPFLIFIGFFIFLGAQGEAELAQTKSALQGYRVADAVMHDFMTLQTYQPLQAAVDLLLNGQSRNFLILDQDRPVGTLSRDEIVRALSQYGAEVPVSQVMNPELVFLQAEMPLEIAWQKMQQHRIEFAPVMHQQHLLGVLDVENIAEFMMVQSVLKSSEARSNFAAKPV